MADLSKIPWDSAYICDDIDDIYELWHHLFIDVFARGYSLIWVIRVHAAGQGIVFWPRCPKQSIQFDLPLSYTVLKLVLKRDFNPDCEQSLSFLRLRHGPCEKLRELAIERRTRDVFVFLICIISTE